jgi:O-antigen/teichoic acid export membrane protein
VSGRERADDAALRLIGVGFAVRFAGMILRTIAGLATTAAALRLLGTSSYGTLALALSAVALIGGMARLGLEPSLARTVAAGGATVGELARAGLTIGGVSAAAGGLVTVAVVGAESDVPGRTALLLAACLAAYLTAAQAAAVAGALARGMGRMLLMELPNVLLAVTTLAGVALVWALDVRALGWVAVAYAGAAVTTIAASLALAAALARGRRSDRPAGEAARALFSLALPYAVTGLAAVMVARLDVVLLGLTHAARDVGTYEPTLRLAEKIGVIASVAATPFLPAATRLVARAGAEALGDLFRVMTRLIYIASLPAVIVLAAFPGAILHALYGGSFRAPRYVVPILVVGGVANLVTGLNTSALSAIADRRALVRVGASGVAAMVVLAVALIPPFGATGAAAATALTVVLANAVASAVLYRLARTQPFDRPFALVCATSLAPVGGALAVSRWAPPHGLLPAAAWSIELWAAWVAFLFATRALRLDELRRLARPGRTRAQGFVARRGAAGT